jgi:hypothetical protein
MVIYDNRLKTQHSDYFLDKEIECSLNNNRNTKLGGLAGSLSL